MTNWMDWYGLALMAVILVPNALFARAHPEGFDNLWRNRWVELLEQAGRLGCFGFMIVRIPPLYLGLWCGRTVYLLVSALLTAAYCLVWLVWWNRDGLFRAIALSVLPSALFLFCGAAARNLPLLAAAVAFAPCHITISVKNALEKGASHDL